MATTATAAYYSGRSTGIRSDMSSSTTQQRGALTTTTHSSGNETYYERQTRLKSEARAYVLSGTSCTIIISPVPVPIINRVFMNKYTISSDVVDVNGDSGGDTLDVTDGGLRWWRKDR